MKVGDLVTIKSDHTKRGWRKTVGIVIDDENENNLYLRRYTILWPGVEESLSEKWLEVIDESR